MRISVLFAVLSSILFFYFVSLTLNIVITSDCVFVNGLLFKTLIVFVFLFINVTKKEFFNNNSNGKFGMTGLIMVFGSVIFLLFAAQNLVLLLAMFFCLFCGTVLVCVGEEK